MARRSKSDAKEAQALFSPGTLYLVHDERARHEVNITLWSYSSRADAELAVDRLMPGDTLMLLSSKRATVSRDEDVRVWKILSKGKIGHIYIAADNLINFRKVSSVD